MARRGRGVLDDDDDAASSQPTSLEMAPLARGEPPVRPDDQTLPAAPSGYRVAPTVEGYTLSWSDARVKVTEGVAALGSHPSNTLVVADPTVSRCHAEIRPEDDRVLVRDLGSTNGTFVDGVRVKEGFLKSGSVLRLGNAEVRFELDGRRHFLDVSEATGFGELVGASPAIRRVFGVLEKAARTDSTLILEGETGTGKTRAAAALRELSPRAAKPFLVVDCGALPPTLLEAELFGHEKGAFTGAQARRVGVFEEADGGTVLLDEIGEMPLELQPRLLRVLEEKQIKRLGQNRMTPVDVRVLAATHKDLRTEVNEGRFRSDLYFRLAVVRVTMPALRERREDVPQVAKALLEQLGATPQSHPGLFDKAFLASLARSSWKGNVRELRNYLERCMLFDEPVPLSESVHGSSPQTSWEGTPLTLARQRVVESFERVYLGQLLARHDGRVAQAAKEAGVDRVYLYRLMRKYGLKAR